MTFFYPDSSVNHRNLEEICNLVISKWEVRAREKGWILGFKIGEKQTYGLLPRLFLQAMCIGDPLILRYRPRNLW